MINDCSRGELIPPPVPLTTPADVVSGDFPDTPRKFLRWWLAGGGDLQGHLCICSNSQTGFRPERHYPVSEYEKAAGLTEALCPSKDMFFGLNLQQSDPGQEKKGGAEGVGAIMGLWADIETASPWHKDMVATPKDVVPFLQSLKYPPGAIVSSGGGIHAYWRFREPWVLEDAGERLRAATLEKGWITYLATISAGRGWKVDPSVGNLDRVLRLPGTFNHKPSKLSPPGEPCPVMLLEHHPERDVSPSDVADFLESIPAERRVPPKTEGVAPGGRGANADHPPADVGPIVEGCAFLRHCRDDSGSLSEPEWYSMLSVIARCKDGEALANKWSEDHPGYSPGETANKIRHALPAAGPVTCERVGQIAGGQYCAQCPHKGRIKSPINLGAQLEAAPLLGNAKYNDYGNGRALIDTCGDRIRHARGKGLGWYAWDGKRWKPNAVKEVSRLAKGVILCLYREASKDPARIQETKFYAKSLNDSPIKAMLASAESEAEIDVNPQDFDRDPWLLNVENGTIDLKAGTLREHRKEDLLTQLAPIDFDPAADCPRWRGLIEDMFQAKPEMAAYIQRVFGYCITGSQSEKAVFILHGGGNNGKTTLLEAFRFVLGDYSGQIPVQALMSSKYFSGTKATPEFADLRGARFVPSSEVAQGHLLDEAVIKYLTGNSTIKARMLHKDYVEFPPTHHFIFDCNHRFDIRGTDSAIWDRVHLILIDFEVPQGRRDKGLLDALRAEASGILNWAIAGCLEWQSRGLDAPEDVKAAVDGYRHDNDTLGQFLEECTERAEGRDISSKDLYRHYCTFCQEINIDRPTHQWFGLAMKARGFIQRKNNRTRRAFYCGIAFRSDIPVREGIRPPGSVCAINA